MEHATLALDPERPQHEVTLRIIHLEDNPLDADLIHAHLRDAGLEFEVVRTDDREGFETALAQGADLILADYSLPQYSGTEALALVREIAARTPVVFVTGALGEERAIDLVKSGATDYVLKDRLHRLVPAVTRALREAHEHSERLRAQDDLRKSEERLRMAQQAAGAGLWDLQLEPDSDAPLSERPIWGADPLSSPPTYGSLMAIIHQEDRERFDSEVHRAMSCDGSIDIQFRIMHPDRGERWLHVVARPVCDDVHGRASRITGIALDVTEHKQAELELEQRAAEVEALYRLSQAVARAARIEDVYEIALESLTTTPGTSRAAILLFDPDGVMRFKAWRGLSDAYRAAAEGHTPWTKDDLDPPPLLVADVLADESLAGFRNVIVGEKIRSLAFIPLLYEGRVLGKFMLYRERPHIWTEEEIRRAQSVANHVAFSLRSKRAERALRDSEERFRALAEAVPDTVFVAGHDGSWEYVNQRFCEYSGLTPDEATGWGWLRAVHAEEVDEVRQAWTESLKSGAPIELTYRVKSASGPYRWFIGRATPVRDRSDRIVKWFGTATDIDALVQSEQELSYHAAQLARSNADLEDFAYVASHDLKEPLRGISNYSTFLLEDYGDQLPIDGREKLETLVRLSKRMYQLLDHLLEYSRAGRAELAIQNVDLKEVIARVQESLKARLEQDEVEITVGSSAPLLRCDPLRLGQVLSNLVVNAIKYNESAVKRIEIGIIPAEDGPAVYVKDNGIGIPAKHAESVFRMFKRLHARDRYGGGSGAGLAIVKKIIQRHNGRIWLESTPAEGTTFYFTLGPQQGDRPRDHPLAEDPLRRQALAPFAGEEETPAAR